MKRDWDVIRAILLDSATGDGPRYDEIDRDELAMHYLLAREAGYLDDCDHLTDRGLEFLRLALDPGVWSRTKRLVLKAVGGLPSAALIAALQNPHGLPPMTAAGPDD